MPWITVVRKIKNQDFEFTTFSFEIEEEDSKIKEQIEKIKKDKTNVKIFLGYDYDENISEASKYIRNIQIDCIEKKTGKKQAKKEEGSYIDIFGKRTILEKKDE